MCKLGLMSAAEGLCCCNNLGESGVVRGRVWRVERGGRGQSFLYLQNRIMDNNNNSKCPVEFLKVGGPSPSASAPHGARIRREDPCFHSWFV